MERHKPASTTAAQIQNRLRFAFFLCHDFSHRWDILAAHKVNKHSMLAVFRGCSSFFHDGGPQKCSPRRFISSLSAGRRYISEWLLISRPYSRRYAAACWEEVIDRTESGEAERSTSYEVIESAALPVLPKILVGATDPYSVSVSESKSIEGVVSRVLSRSRDDRYLSAEKTVLVRPDSSRGPFYMVHAAGQILGSFKPCDPPSAECKQPAGGHKRHTNVVNMSQGW